MTEILTLILGILFLISGFVGMGQEVAAQVLWLRFGTGMLLIALSLAIVLIEGE